MSVMTVSAQAPPRKPGLTGCSCLRQPPVLLLPAQHPPPAPSHQQPGSRTRAIRCPVHQTTSTAPSPGWSTFLCAHLPCGCPLQITTVMFALVCLMVWELHPLLVSPLIIIFFIEVLFLSSNLMKVPGEALQGCTAMHGLPVEQVWTLLGRGGNGVVFHASVLYHDLHNHGR